MNAERRDVPTIGEIRDRIGDEEFVRRILAALDELPDPTRRQLAAMWISDTWWRFRDALHTVRFYP